MHLLILPCVVCLAVSAPVLNLGSQAQLKSAVAVTPLPPDPAVICQGGGTIETATVIPNRPFTDSGTTVGYSDEYEEVCP